MKDKILITGSTGRLGRELIKQLQNALHPDRSEMDVTQKNNVELFIEKNKPTTIIHLAALTDVKKCEENKGLAWKINVEGTTNLVGACEQIIPSCYFVLMSTPCVFSGEEGNYSENSIPYPRNFYGFTKAVQEIIVLRSKLKSLVIRGNFVPREKWPYPKAFIDRFGTYLFADQLARAIKEVIEAKLTGIVHIVGDKKISMFELAKRCPQSENIQPYTLQEYYKETPTSCKLTRDMSLISVRWKSYNIDES
jgi:dTDP-4-dehydrorhamnose reductase